MYTVESVIESRIPDNSVVCKLMAFSSVIVDIDGTIFPCSYTVNLCLLN